MEKYQLKSGHPLFNFKHALLLSFFIHALVAAQLSYSHAPYLKKPIKNIEVAYYNFKIQPKNPVLSEQQKNTAPQDKAEKSTEVFLKRDFTPPPFLKDIAVSQEKFGLQKEHLELPLKQKTQINSLVVKRRVSVRPPLKSEKINIPGYRNYSQGLSNAIRLRAYANYSKYDSLGTVYLTFVITSEGVLKQVKISEEMTSGDGYLKEISLKSIQEASASFLAFPPSLRAHYPEMTVNVEISYKAED